MALVPVHPVTPPAPIHIHSKRPTTHDDFVLLVVIVVVVVVALIVAALIVVALVVVIIITPIPVEHVHSLVPVRRNVPRWHVVLCPVGENLRHHLLPLLRRCDPWRQILPAHGTVAHVKVSSPLEAI